jgi:parvulin-like peptidyl-prolyl isomerase
MYMKRILFFLIAAVMTVSSAAAQTDLQPAAIVRLTKSEPITVKQFRTETERIVREQLMMSLRRTPTQEEMTKAVQNLSSQEKRQILDIMINDKLAVQAAERDKVTISDNEINQQIQQFKSGLAQNLGRTPSDDEFASLVRTQMGIEMPALREQLRKQLVIQKYLMAQKQDQFKNVSNPTDAEIQNAYNLARAQLVRPDTVRFSLIQVLYGVDSAAKAKAKETADRLIREIGASPSKFDETFIKGQAPTAGYQAGDGGYLPRNLQAQEAMGASFLNAAFSLKQGEVSRLIEGLKGYQIIKVTETYGQKNLELDDIFQLGTRITVREYIYRSLLQDKQEEAIRKATNELVAELRKGNPFQVFESNLTW